MQRILLVGLVGACFAFTGCQSIQSAGSNVASGLAKGVSSFDNWVGAGTVDVFNNFENKKIRDAFLVLEMQNEKAGVMRLKPELLAAKFKREKRTYTTIYLEKYVWNQANYSDANRKIEVGDYVSEKDEAAKLFIEQARASGNEVRLYKKSVNRAINDGLKQVISDINGSQNRYDADPAMIEFDKNGSPVAIMSRSWQTLGAIGVDSRIYTNIYTGESTMRWFENEFGNKSLENNLIRVIKQKSTVKNERIERSFFAK